jgi:cytochrome c-type biogenesis protein CcmH/NrfG
MNEICAWCPVEGKCIQLNANETCQYSNESSTGVTVCAAEQVLTPAAIAGLSAGVIAAIVIAIVVVLAVTAGVSGRYIYVRMHQSSAPDPIVQNNPTYEDKTTLKESAIYEAPPQQSAT